MIENINLIIAAITLLSVIAIIFGAYIVLTGMGKKVKLRNLSTFNANEGGEDAVATPEGLQQMYMQLCCTDEETYGSYEPKEANAVLPMVVETLNNSFHSTIIQYKKQQANRRIFFILCTNVVKGKAYKSMVGLWAYKDTASKYQSNTVPLNPGSKYVEGKDVWVTYKSMIFYPDPNLGLSIKSDTLDAAMAAGKLTPIPRPDPKPTKVYEIRAEFGGHHLVPIGIPASWSLSDSVMDRNYPNLSMIWKGAKYKPSAIQLLKNIFGPAIKDRKSICLSGPGGTGKTRLLNHFASEMALQDNVRLVLTNETVLKDMLKSDFDWNTFNVPGVDPENKRTVLWVDDAEHFLKKHGESFKQLTDGPFAQLYGVCFLISTNRKRQDIDPENILFRPGRCLFVDVENLTKEQGRIVGQHMASQNEHSQKYDMAALDRYLEEVEEDKVSLAQIYDFYNWEETNQLEQSLQEMTAVPKAATLKVPEKREVEKKETEKNQGRRRGR